MDTGMETTEEKVLDQDDRNKEFGNWLEEQTEKERWQAENGVEVFLERDELLILEEALLRYRQFIDDTNRNSAAAFKAHRKVFAWLGRLGVARQ